MLLYDLEAIQGSLTTECTNVVSSARKISRFCIINNGLFARFLLLKTEHFFFKILFSLDSKIFPTKMTAMTANDDDDDDDEDDSSRCKINSRVLPVICSTA